MKQLIITLFVLLCVQWVNAQGAPGAQLPATGLRADGKIYVVMAVVITILAGLLLYVIRLDRKISRLEKQSS